MFSPATRKSHLLHPRHQKDKDRRNAAAAAAAAPDSPSTPSSMMTMIPNRPSTGTPAPWSSRLSVLARIPSANTSEKGAAADSADQTQPVYVGEFPQVVRDAQTLIMQKSIPGIQVVVVSGSLGFFSEHSLFRILPSLLFFSSLSTGDNMPAGGMDKESSLSWMICGNQLFIWSYLSATLSRRCSVLDIPPSALSNANTTTTTTTTSTKSSGHANPWMVCIVRWDVASTNSVKAVARCKSAGAVLFNRRTQALVYWPDIYVDSGNFPILSLPPPEEAEEIGLSGDGADSSSEYDWFNSIIASAIPGTSHECIVIGCQSNGNLWHFHLTPTGASRKRASQSARDDSCADHSPQSKGQARSIIWRLQHVSLRDSSREFFLLTNNEIQCWNVVLAHDVNIARLWSQEIVGSDGELGIKKDLAGQKHIWLLDFQVDDRGKDFTILVATFCMDRVSSSSYTQYSLLTMQYKPVQNQELTGSMNKRILERKAPLQVIIPKARVEDESFLLSMRLRIGGKPSGSAIILSGDGTATVTNYWRGSTRLYQFDLPWDAGRVLDASVFPSAEESDEGSWVVLTEKAGNWAIPEKAVLLGAVEPPERSLSRKGSSNEGAAEEEKRIQAFGSNITPRRVSSEAWSTGGRQRTVLTGIGQRTAQDEEAEALLGRLFNEFILSGEVEGAFEKLRVKGAFEKEGETNVFARVSKSIVDTLAKHWTTTRGAEFVASAVVSSLLLDKQQKHQKYLQFLALSKCHEELSSKQSKCSDSLSFSYILHVWPQI